MARALRDLPVIRGEFAAARLSYAKVRALTRIATPDTEAGLAEIAGPMTGNQLERFARAHRQVSQADDAAARVRRRLAWRFEEDGSLAGTFRLPPLQGAVLLQALRAAAGDLEHPHKHEEEGAGVSAETPAAAGLPVVATSSSLADALLVVAEAFLAGKVAGADDPEVYQVVVHVGADALTDAPSAVTPGPAGVSAETPVPAPSVPGDPADPGRCHVEDGPAISVSTAQMLGCTAALSWMVHDRDGSVLRLGRRRRRPNAALRRAARERDTCRCRFPGCESRRVDLHHIQFWSHGGRTDLDNLHQPLQIPPHAGARPRLPDRHHPRRHLRLLPVRWHRHPAQPRPARPRRHHRGLSRRRHHPRHDHPAVVRREARPGSRHLRLLRQRPHRPGTAGQPDQAGEPAARDGIQVFEPEGWADRISQYYAEHAARPPRPLLVPIPV